MATTYYDERAKRRGPEGPEPRGYRWPTPNDLALARGMGAIPPRRNLTLDTLEELLLPTQGDLLKSAGGQPVDGQELAGPQRAPLPWERPSWLPLSAGALAGPRAEPADGLPGRPRWQRPEAAEAGALSMQVPPERAEDLEFEQSAERARQQARQWAENQDLAAQDVIEEQRGLYGRGTPVTPRQLELAGVDPRSAGLTAATELNRSHAWAAGHPTRASAGYSLLGGTRPMSGFGPGGHMTLGDRPIGADALMARAKLVEMDRQWRERAAEAMQGMEARKDIEGMTPTAITALKQAAGALKTREQMQAAGVPFTARERREAEAPRRDLVTQNAMDRATSRRMRMGGLVRIPLPDEPFVGALALGGPEYAAQLAGVTNQAMASQYAADREYAGRSRQAEAYENVARMEAAPALGRDILQTATSWFNQWLQGQKKPPNKTASDRAWSEFYNRAVQAALPFTSMFSGGFAPAASTATGAPTPPGPLPPSGLPQPNLPAPLSLGPLPAAPPATATAGFELPENAKALDVARWLTKNFPAATSDPAQKQAAIVALKEGGYDEKTLEDALYELDPTRWTSGWNWAFGSRNPRYYPEMRQGTGMGEWAMKVFTPAETEPPRDTAKRQAMVRLLKALTGESQL